MPFFDLPIGEEQLRILGKYSTKIKAPIYEPKRKKPSVLSLVDSSKMRNLIKNIENSDVSNREKEFLIEAAHRHSIFNFNLIADYYAHATAEMQELMEESGLVIIDFNKAIEFGFVKLTDEIADQYSSEDDDE